MNNPSERWSDYNPDDHAVLCFLRGNGRILLMRKKRGLGAGKINAPGGKVEPGETMREAAVRETAEEVGLTPRDPDHRGTLRFAFADGYRLEVHLFIARRWSGRLTETDEADPFWVSEHEIPFDEMWEDDRWWLPHVLEGRSVEALMSFDGDRMVEWDIHFSDGMRMHGP